MRRSLPLKSSGPPRSCSSPTGTERGAVGGKGERVVTELRRIGAALCKIVGFDVALEIGEVAVVELYARKIGAHHAAQAIRQLRHECGIQMHVGMHAARPEVPPARGDFDIRVHEVARLRKLHVGADAGEK